MSEQFSEKPAEFLTARAYPTEPPAQPVAKPARSRIVQNLLAGLFLIVAVAAATWIKMNSVSTGSKEEGSLISPPNPIGAAAVIKFPFIKAVWDKEDDDYALEIEKKQDGHFDFPFENVSNQPAEIGMFTRSCDCSHLDVCLVPQAEWEAYSQEIVKNPLAAHAGNWTWTKITENETKGFEVPPAGKGFVRIGWEARKEPGSRLRLSIQVWHQPKGHVRERSFEKLEVPIMLAAPLMFTPARANVGQLGPNDSVPAEFTLWSATRSTLNLKVGDNTDPHFVHESSPLTKEECAELEKTMRKGGENTRVRSAHRVKVMVHEQVAGKQLDQGPFQRVVNLLLDDEKISGPVIVGSVKGDIIVGNAEDRGKADLRIFRAKDGARREVSLWTDDKTVLSKESHTPATLQVKLSKQETAGSRAKWVLEVTVPPDTQFGVFSEDSAIILRTQSTPPRYIRIPVAGIGQS